VVAQIVIRDNGIYPVHPVIEKRIYVFRENALKGFYKEVERHPYQRVELAEEIERGKSLGFVLRVFSPFQNEKGE
jgi:hypothetical protein